MSCRHCNDYGVEAVVMRFSAGDCKVPIPTVVGDDPVCLIRLPEKHELFDVQGNPRKVAMLCFADGRRMVELEPCKCRGEKKMNTIDQIQNLLRVLEDEWDAQNDDDGEQTYDVILPNGTKLFTSEALSCPDIGEAIFYKDQKYRVTDIVWAVGNEEPNFDTAHMIVHVEKDSHKSKVQSELTYYEELVGRWKSIAMQWENCTDPTESGELMGKLIKAILGT